MSEPAEESAAQLVARLVSVCRPQMHNLDSKIFPNNGPFAKEIAEISGDVGLGKTTLLMHIMARTILPLECGGKDGMVVFLMTEHNFDLDKFICVLGKYIAECTTSNASETDVLHTSLQNITIQRCFDDTQFELAIYDLHRILPESNRYCLLALDSIGAFYFTSKAPDRGQTFYMKDVLSKLQLVIVEHNLALVYTKPSYFVEKSTLDTVENVNYFLELIEKRVNETDDSKLVYKVDIPRSNQIVLCHYEFDVNGCIEWKE